MTDIASDPPIFADAMHQPRPGDSPTDEPAEEGGNAEPAEDGEPLADVLGFEPADRLTVLVPSRGRPAAIADVMAAWRDTGADKTALLVVVIDHDETAPYEDLRAEPWLWLYRTGTEGMASSVNAAARETVAWGARYLAVQNDDHLPRTAGWVGMYTAALDELRARFGVGVVYGDDLLRGESLCSEWAVTDSWVATLGRMVPALVRHQYADTSVRDLARALGCLRYLPAVVIEHMHPTAGKREWDEVTTAVNARARRVADRMSYDRWTMRPPSVDKTGLARQAARLRALRPPA